MGKLRLSTRVWNIISGPSLLTDLQSGDWLYLAEFWFNTNYLTATKFTPFEALYGTASPRLLDYIPETTQVAAVDSVLQSRQQIMSLLKQNLVDA